MRWTVHGERSIYRSHWLHFDIVDVELPDGTRLDHEVVRSPRDGAATVVLDERRGVLMIHRHRFIADRWGWELPGGMIEVSEDPADGAAREVLEETGWRPGPLQRLTTLHPSSGWSDQRFHIFLADGAERVGEPTERNESDRIEWRRPEQLAEDLRAGAIPDGLAQFGLAFALARLGGVDLTPGGPWSNGTPAGS
jgi:8-oxo-dGTP pyrophosphatase MutT (NUDIX family)